MENIKYFNVTDDTFQISPQIPEFLSYTSSDCDKLEYSTKSTNVHGEIKTLKYYHPGFNYKKLPQFKKVNSENGKDANLLQHQNNW